MNRTRIHGQVWQGGRGRSVLRGPRLGLEAQSQRPPVCRLEPQGELLELAFLERQAEKRPPNSVLHYT